MLSHYERSCEFVLPSCNGWIKRNRKTNGRIEYSRLIETHAPSKDSWNKVQNQNGRHFQKSKFT